MSPVSTAALLRLYYVAVFAALGVLVPFFPSWLEARGIRGFELGLVTGVMPLVSLLSPLLFGYLADRLSLRAALIRVACVGAGLSMGVLGLLGGLGVELSLGLMLLLVASFSFFRSPLVMVADVSAMESPANYGRLRLWGSLGFLLMALFAGQTLDVKSGSQLPLFVGCCLLAALAFSFGLPARTARPAGPVLDGVKELLEARHFRWFLVVALLWFASHSGYDLVVARHIRDLGGTGSHVGMAWALGVSAEVFLMAFSAALFSRYSAAALLSAAMFVTTLRWAALGLAPSLGWVFVTQPLHAVSFGLNWLAALAFIKQHAPESARATAQGAFTTAAALGASGGALLWGPLYESRGGRAVFAVAAAVALLGALCTLPLHASSRALGPLKYR